MYSAIPFHQSANPPNRITRVHLQLANLLEKQTSHKHIFLINPCKYYLPLWKNDTTLLKLHAQLTYK